MSCFGIECSVNKLVFTAPSIGTTGQGIGSCLPGLAAHLDQSTRQHKKEGITLAARTSKKKERMQGQRREVKQLSPTQYIGSEAEWGKAEEPPSWVPIRVKKEDERRFHER
ncbi:hypothetical protein CASFOL_009574 [Castilleja foliolosa]|uniref:Uncharacterized protein n=1 Tax=Castilleja foliolosa TaxID=1961234 RepID=A0ABD3DYC3_9LAMI